MKHNSPFADTDRSLAGAKIERLQRELDELKERLVEGALPNNTSAAASQNVHNAVERRRRRERLFGEGLFFDPAWDILLDLYLADIMQNRVSVSELGLAAAIPPTTTLRWVAKLEECGFVVRRPDPLDRRRVFIELTGKAQAAMQAYFAD